MSQYSLRDLATRQLAAGERVGEHRDVLAMLRAIVCASRHPAEPTALLHDPLRHRAAPVAPQRVPSLLPPNADRALLLDFVVESRDLLEEADLALQGLAHEPDHAEAINPVFRALHTLKGTSAFLALTHVSEFAHHAESLLSRVRDRELRCVGETAELVLRSLDMLRALLVAIHGAIDGHAEELPEGYARLLATLRDAGVPRGASREAVAGSATAAHGEGRTMADAATAVASAARVPSDAGRAPVRREGHERATESTVRVRTDALDRLIELVGELVAASAMVAQHSLVRHDAQGTLQQQVAGTGKLIRELQHLSMTMRMVPLQLQFDKVERLVRDLAFRSGKRIEFIAEGEQIEIDRQVAERLSDPLLHMVRNAVDHGIELPAERRTAGKPVCGSVHLRAYRTDGGVVLELRDDGRGLDRDRLVHKALQLGHIGSDDGLSDADVHALIFRPGFSTADRVTDVSGRGVGMDVVRSSIEALGGRVGVSSRAGNGTTVCVQLPPSADSTDGPRVHDVPGHHQGITKPYAEGTGSLPESSGEALLAEGGLEFVLDVDTQVVLADDGDPAAARVDITRAVV